MDFIMESQKVMIKQLWICMEAEGEWVEVVVAEEI